MVVVKDGNDWRHFASGQLTLSRRLGVQFFIEKLFVLKNFFIFRFEEAEGEGV